MKGFLKFIFSFIVINLSVLLGITLIFYILGLFGIYINAGNNLFLYSLIIGFVGSFISLLLSKFIINWQYNITYFENEREIRQFIEENNLPIEYFYKLKKIFEELEKLNEKNNLKVKMGIYNSEEPNAFAFGCGLCGGHNIAFSIGIISLMNEEELIGVLGHEYSHILNGDVITTTILQGFLDTFVIYISKLLAGVITNNDDEDGGNGFLEFILTIIFEIIFGIIASIILAYYSRIREYKADEGSAKLFGKSPMIEALMRLKYFEENGLIGLDNREVATTMKIDNKKSLLHLFATHPELDDRIKHLEKLKL